VLINPTVIDLFEEGWCQRYVTIKHIFWHSKLHLCL